MAAVIGTALMFCVHPDPRPPTSPCAPPSSSLRLLLATPSLAAVALYRMPMVAGLGLEAIPRRDRAPRLSPPASASGSSSLGLIEMQYAVWPPPEGYLEGFRRLHEALRPAGPLDAVWSAIAIAAAPALFEETTVRGVLLPSLRPSLGGLGAVLVSAVVFALMHADPYRFAFTFAVGVALGLLRVRTGSLWPSMLAHGTLNLLTFATAPWLDDPSEPLPDPRPWLAAGLLLLGFALSWLVFRKLRSDFDSFGDRA